MTNTNTVNKTSKADEDCQYCDGQGGYSKYCCAGHEDGVQSCGCAGMGTWEECSYCNDGKVEVEDIEWDFETLDEADAHDYQVYYSILGKGNKTGKEYIGTAIYTCEELDEITDIEEA